MAAGQIETHEGSILVLPLGGFSLCPYQQKPELNAFVLYLFRFNCPFSYLSFKLVCDSPGARDPADVENGSFYAIEPPSSSIHTGEKVEDGNFLLNKKLKESISGNAH